MKTVACPIITYAVVGFMTFAWVYESFGNERYSAREPASLVAGMFWPIYWPGIGALALMRLLKHTTTAKQCYDRQANRGWAPDEDGVCIFQPSQPK